MSQTAILENHTILKATEVDFPPKPSVSNEAKVCIGLKYLYFVAGAGYVESYPNTRAKNLTMQVI